MQTRMLRTFARIAQIGSFAQTAEHLNMTLSAVSMQMKTLEEELGVKLFDRSYRPPQLTPIGRAVAENAISLLYAEDTLVRLCYPDDKLAGHFRIGLVTTASVRLIPGFLKNAAKLAPDATFSLETGLSEFLERKVLSGQLDAAIVTASSNTDAQLHYELLYDEPLVFAIPSGIKHVPFDTLIADRTFLQFMPSTGIGKLISNQMFKLRKGKQSSAVVLNNVEAIVECVKAGVGFTLLPKPDILRYADESVHIMCPEEIQLSRKLVLTTVHDSFTHHWVKTLKNLLIS
ncbi:DNA-binding transcriptional regulator, LysR family [Cohaesibacter gelatinilyticus]|uniref:DNA-binding transcriptional regulator, LysR family n=2 Tax=Cohaesibacter gelatinilyticus TaxID=372072 RepID=A0A285PC80_9HYPH|nr:DNA-binding transcriptional regulator, LysR family [Cohaesibacter gelatinilyticus]